MKKIYVGNLPYEATESEIETLFTEFGPVSSVSIVTDRQTGRARGFGFVEMESNDDAAAAIAGLNGREMGSRKLAVNEARERENRPGGGGGGHQDSGDRDW